MITHTRLRELAHYCPETGQFTHLKSKGRKKAGMPAGSVRRDGYVYVMFDGYRGMAHQFAWLYVTGEWPTQEIDHMDGNKANNEASNLEWCTRSHNTRHARHVLKLPGGGLPPRSIFAVDCQTGEKKKYPSIEEATRDGYTSANIYRCLKEPHRTHGGKKWTREDPIPRQQEERVREMVDVMDTGQQSLQLVFRSREAANAYKASILAAQNKEQGR